MSHILAVASGKGGVGKTLTTAALATLLNRKGYRVLAVDADMGLRNLDLPFGVQNEVLYDVVDIMKKRCIAEEAILSLAPGLDFLAASQKKTWEKVDTPLFRKILEGLSSSYDYILIDCPPSLGLLTINALVAADKLLVPIQCEFYALEGVTKLLDSMKRVKSILNPSLDIFGIVLTMYDSRTNLANQVVNEVRSFFGDEVFETLIPRTVKLSEAPSYGQSILEYAPDNKGALAYNDLAKEVIARG